MDVLNLPPAPLRLSEQDGRTLVWDVLRRKQVVCTPEEWVRQHMVHLLHGPLGYPLSQLAAEKAFRINGLQKRFDLLAFYRGTPVMVVECKAPSVPVTEEVFHQAMRYNLHLQVPLLVVTNGLQHYVLDLGGDDPVQLNEIPPYSSWK